MSVRKPYESEYPLLSELALKSKAYWGYDPSFIPFNWR
ncbi:BH1043 [Halalkalibacterium halodurans C-125]|jgi:hypothetical protein|uniref:BH1043 protein n=1 Tax=Halalkalibacterium halodurans (strain ATCC BAA-125 / DSM 18197 / FERM 7344 / JCM 9153 / C-125) TaxID=272558 RepID=Q9KE15_HALH5|nr:BH1043 [Halalkalibacterium halodurans C-125]